MNKCLVTKLNGIVNNGSLLKIGELRIKTKKLESPSDGSNILSISFNKDTEVQIIGDGYFTDSNNQNLGKVKSVSAGNIEDLKFSNGDYEISIANKYAITFIQLKGANYFLDVAGFKYSKDLKSITLFAGTEGDISDLSDLVKVTKVSITRSSVSGNISSLSNLLDLTEISLSNSNVDGGIDSLKTLTKLDILNLENTKVSGDLSLLAPSARFLGLNSANGQIFSWANNRASNSKILAIYGNPRIADVDAMLINQASCQKGFTDSEHPMYKYIQVVGKRTSASDTAVSKLQELGYTVSVLDI